MAKMAKHDKSHILVVDDNPTSTKMMSILLTKEGYQVTVKNDPVDALKWLRNPINRPALMISDLNMPGINGHELVGRIKKDPSLGYLPIIMLTAQHDMTQKVAGFEAGVDDYLTKPVSSTELLLRIRALLARAQAASNPETRLDGQVFTVFSLRGGVGTSTLAVNLAVALAQLWQTKVPLVDLNLQNGHCALMLDTKPQNTIVQLAQTNVDEIDIELIEKLLHPHPTQVAVLPAPLTAAEAELIEPEIVQQVLPYLRVEYPFTVVDAGSHLDEISLAALDASTHILLTVAPELASLKAASDAMRIFAQLDYTADRIFPVLNTPFAKGGISQKAVEAAVGAKVRMVLPYGGEAIVKAINAGKPIVAAQPNLATSKAIAGLAFQFSPDELKQNPPERPSPLLRYFLG